MKRKVIILLLIATVLTTGARRRSDDTTYYWKDRMDAVGRILSLGENKFLGAGFYTSPYGAIITASHLAIQDTVLFEHIHSREIDTLTVSNRVAHHDLAILRPLAKNPAARLGLQFGVPEGPLDSVMYLGLREDRTLFRFDARLSAVGNYTLPGDSVAVRAMAIDAEVLAGMSGGPVLNERGEVIGVLVGRLTNTPQGGADSTAVLAIPTDTIRLILDADSSAGK